MTYKTALKRIEKCRAIIARERDKLRIVLDEMEPIYDVSCTAIENLENAIDSLSEQITCLRNELYLFTIERNIEWKKRLRSAK